MQKTTVVLLAIIALWWGCSSTPTGYRRQIFDEKNVPLGLHFNQTQEDILRIFGEKNLKNHTPSFLFYDFPLSGNDSYTYAFKFYHDTLYGMEIGVFTQDAEIANTLFNEMIDEFNKNITQHNKIDSRLHAWYFRDTVSGKNAEIDLRNESERFGVVTVILNNIDF